MGGGGVTLLGEGGGACGGGRLTIEDVCEQLFLGLTLGVHSGMDLDYYLLRERQRCCGRTRHPFIQVADGHGDYLAECGHTRSSMRTHI
jgi:hypothetical protein